MQFFIFIIVVLFSALFLGFIARQKGADAFFWTVMGGLFGPLAIPFVFFAKPKSRKPPNSNTEETKR